MPAPPRYRVFRCPGLKVAGRTAHLVAPWLAALVASLPLSLDARAEPPLRAELPVGRVVLEACAHGAYCGRLERPLDPDGVVPGSVSVLWEFYAHTGPGPSRGTLVATEGGPGYPATESRADYLALFAPLRVTRDVLIVDNRGTGRSGAVDCHALQTGESWTVKSVGECGRSLGDYASLYSTVYAADDLAAILTALGIEKIDLYGDSYGTYFEQVFATRHPRALRSIVLDGAYPLDGPDYAWYPTYAPAMRDKFNLACQRSSACASLPGSSIDHILPALEALRRAPFAASGTDLDGTSRRFEANASQLAIVMFAAAPAATSVAETDAAARAFVAGDRLPLLRLMAETAAAVDSRDPSANPMQWSAGLAAAVLCGDPPQIFDMSSSPGARRADRDRRLAERRRQHPDTYAPFSIDEFRGMPLDYSFLDECVDWPVRPPGHPAVQIGTDAVYPDVPALVISGELDDITTPADGATVAAAFPHGRQIRIANSFHVNALPRARSACAASIVQHFLATRTVGRTECATEVPPVRLVPRFVLHSIDLEPATPLLVNRTDTAGLQIVSAVVATVGDVLARAKLNDGGHGVGLRGGSFKVTINDTAMRVTLHDVRWVEDVAVSGILERPTGRSALVRAHLRFASSSSSAEAPRRGALRLRWLDGTEPSEVRIEGRIGRLTVRARRAAP